MSVVKGANTLGTYAYTLGPAGNRLSVSELSGRTVSYGYDDLYRLTSETIANSPSNNGVIAYVYDNVGNRLTRTSEIAAVPSASSSYDDNDRLTSDGYDANGSTIGSGGNVYQYDFENRLIALNPGTANEVSFVYDGDGNRVAKTVDGVTTKFLVDTNSPTGYAQVAEEIVSGSVQRVYVHGHSLISQTQLISGNWATSFYGFDGHGSVRFLIDTTGAITDTYTFDAFGSLIASTATTPNNYIYAGEQLDPNLGFYYLRARYMNPASGRFWSMDTFDGVHNDPHTLHKYLYAGTNPTNKIDPSGRFEFTIAGVTYNLSLSQTMRAISTTGLALGRAALLRLLTLAFVVNAAMNSPVLQHFGEEMEELEGGGMAAIETVQGAFQEFEGVVPEAEAELSSVMEGGAQNYDKLREFLNQFFTRVRTNPPNIEWHHLVEQNQAETDTEVGFSLRAINSLSNVVPTPTGVHDAINRFYSSGAPWLASGATTVRQWMATQDWETQWRAGLEIWKQAMNGQITWHP
jgi:RHS repeat-associated protein